MRSRLRALAQGGGRGGAVRLWGWVGAVERGVRGAIMGDSAGVQEVSGHITAKAGWGLYLLGV